METLDTQETVHPAPSLDGSRLVAGSWVLGLFPDGTLMSYDSFFEFPFVFARDISLVGESFVGNTCWVTTSGDAFCRDGSELVQLSLDGAHVSQIAASADTVCVLVTDGSVRCWSAAQLSGSGAVIDGIANATQIALAAVEISSAPQYATTGCAVIAGGGVRCWGDNLYGQVGNGVTGGTMTTAAPVLDGDNDNKPLADAITIDMRSGRSYAVLDDGTVHVWGANVFSDREAVATRIPKINNATSVAAGSWLDCALAGGQIACWGGTHDVGIDLGFVPYVPR